MERTSAIQRERKTQTPQENWPHSLQEDPRWCLAQRIVAGSHFARSPLLSKFLLFIVAETLEGRGSEITEHQIGVQVFDRRRGYSTIEDNIVRNYARQVRKRLAEHFAGEGRDETLRVDVPVGGYVPVFFPADESRAGEDERGLPVSFSLRTRPLFTGEKAEQSDVKINWRRWILRASVIALYSAAIILLTWFVATRPNPPHSTDPAHPLWSALFAGPANCYIVPADAGFNLLEDLSRRPLPLADYIKGEYLDMPLAGVDAHSADDLRSQQFTSFVDFQTVAALARLPEYNPQRTFLRFPRDLRIDDMKNANAVLIGSVGSNPWSSIADSSANFRIVYRQGMQGATIVNTSPRPGEADSYESHWSEPAHETFALISFLPNLGGSGRLLLLQGLDVAGTQAAAEALFNPAVIAGILKQATRPDGSLRSFEILLRATSIESNATGTQVAGSRIY